VGNYRILYEIDDKARLIMIYPVKHRRNVYKTPMKKQSVNFVTLQKIVMGRQKSTFCPEYALPSEKERLLS